MTDPLRRMPSREANIGWWHAGRLMGYLPATAIRLRLARQKAPSVVVADFDAGRAITVGEDEYWR